MIQTVVSVFYEGSENYFWQRVYLAGLLSNDGNKLLEILPGPPLRVDDWEQLQNFRARLEDDRPVTAAPGHLFKSGDHQLFRSLLAQLLESPGAWSFYIYGAPSRTTLLLGERIEVWSPKKGIRNELGRYLALPQAAWFAQGAGVTSDASA